MWDDSEVPLNPPRTLVLPAAITVDVGNAGNHRATLTFSLNGVQTTCAYHGGAAQAHPSPDDPRQWMLGLSYIDRAANFPADHPNGHLCDDGSDPGAVIQADFIKLSVNGDSYQPPAEPKTTATATLLAP